MSTFINTLYRDLTCALAAVVITIAMSMSFVESTATYPTHNHTSVTAPRA
jgi:hypothetical protein